MMHGTHDIKREETDYRILHRICNGNRIYSDNAKSKQQILQVLVLYTVS
jgi:hypothetical protein